MAAGRGWQHACVKHGHERGRNSRVAYDGPLVQAVGAKGCRAESDDPVLSVRWYAREDHLELPRLTLVRAVRVPAQHERSERNSSSQTPDQFSTTIHVADAWIVQFKLRFIFDIRVWRGRGRS